MTGHHENCKTEIRWYDNVWYCYCKTCKTQEKEKTNDNTTEETVRSEETGEQNEPEIRYSDDGIEQEDSSSVLAS